MKLITTNEAVNLIKDNSSLGTVGFMLTGAPENLFLEIENKFLETGSPKNLSIMFASGIGDGAERGVNHLAHDGLLKRIIAGHYGLMPKIGKLVSENKVEAYNFPQGVLTSMFREMAAKRPGVLTTVGLGTFVDPDFESGQVNSISKEEIVKKLNIEGQDYLLYKSQKIDIALIRGTECDEYGNIGYSKEALKLESLSVAMAAKNNGGIVIAQVSKQVKNGEIDPRNILVPGAMVDYITIVDDEKNHMQTGGTQFNEKFITVGTSEGKEEIQKLPTAAKTIIARRCAEFMDDTVKIVNYGIGLPEQVAAVVKESGKEHNFISTVEPGVLGGTAQGGLDFGSAIYPQSIINHQHKFDFYDGGGIDCTFLGMAQCNKDGSINVSKFGPKIPGCGGFINISQNAKKVIFCGTFTASGAKYEIKDKKLNIITEGRNKKFINELEQITFNGVYEGKKNKEIYVVTERAVFKIEERGLVLIEIAPGIDLDKDILANMEFKPIISENLVSMDECLFV